MATYRERFYSYVGGADQQRLINIEAKARAALATNAAALALPDPTAANNTYAALPSPSVAQNTAQTKALTAQSTALMAQMRAQTRQMDAIIRLLMEDFTSETDT